MRSRFLLSALATAVVPALITPAHAQLNINLGGVSVSVGGGSGGVNVGVDGPGGLDVNVGLGGSGGSDSDLPDNSASAEPPTQAELTQGRLSQKDTLAAVKAKRAVPLAPIVAQLQQANLKVVDAHLLTVRGILLYEIRVIAERGDVSEVYFYARSGRQVVATAD